MKQELAYSFHLGNDKNKSKLAKKVSKENIFDTTSLSNNAIQNANDLSKANKHNLRDYDHNKEEIFTVYGTSALVNDLNILMDDFGNSYYKLEKDNDSLTYQISLKDEEINNLKKELSIIVAPKQEREIFYD